MAWIRTNAFAWMLLFPSLVFLVLFTYYPIANTIKLSFYQADLSIREPIYVAFDNYKTMLHDPIFRKVFMNNLWFAAGTIPAALALALAMAVFANKALKARGLVRTAFFYPTIIPMIAIANIWLFIYTPQYGLLDRLVSVIGSGEHNYLGSPHLVMWAMIAMIVWKEAGYFMIFYLAGMQSISKELYEAAETDGVGGWTIFRKITFPLLLPTTLFVLIVALTNSYKLMDHLWIMTKGGPNNASNLLLYHIYETAFSFWDQGMASTLTVAMVLLLLVLSALQFFGMDKKIHYQ
ncbi:sugar ABC transporter permease [Gorillibacterium sp. CAU 1737]|uniref:carbohydrate ABC transporter permease n=1 Tax=Gorillibacterium sp. CAU 1737 TaxID=3140362 RepID=UPI0032606CCF